MFKTQEFSRSINSQHRPSPVSLPMLKPRLASPCLLRLCIWLQKCQYQEKHTLTMCYKQHALMACGLLEFFAFFLLILKGFCSGRKEKEESKFWTCFFLGRTKNPTNLQKKHAKCSSLQRQQQVKLLYSFSIVLSP